MDVQNVSNLLAYANAANDKQREGSEIAARLAIKIMDAMNDNPDPEKDLEIVCRSLRQLIGQETNYLLRVIIDILIDIAGVRDKLSPAQPDWEGPILIPMSAMSDELKGLFKDFGLDLDSLFSEEEEIDRSDPTPEPVSTDS